MIKYLWVCLFCLATLPVSAKCFLGDAYVEKGRMKQAEEAYLMCAQSGDNVDANYALGKIYRDGTAGTKDLYRALFYFRFAAENGSAAAQRELAKTMFMLRQQGKEGLALIDRYEEKMAFIKGRLGQSEEPIYAYTWLLLAAEKAENKWYYPAGAQQDSEAVRLYNSMKDQLTAAERQQVMAQASAFKEEKLNQTAQMILSADEYATFRSVLYPENGQVQLSRRGAELTKLKEKVMLYQKPALQDSRTRATVQEQETTVEMVEPVDVPGRLGFSNN